MTRLGDFRHFWATIFRTKVAQVSGDFCAYFQNTSFLSMNVCGYFLGSLEEFAPLSGHTTWPLSNVANLGQKS